MGQVLNYIKSFRKTAADKNIIFAYDLKSTSKHFIAGTLVANNVDELVRYDDFDIIKRKKGLEIQSLGIYRAQNRIIGYEIVYKDATSGTISLKRIPPGFNAFRNKTCVTLKLQHNEHLVDIDLVYTQDEIKYIEFMTSKGNSLKVGTQVEDGYTSFNKVDIAQKNYASIIAFESTFSKDCLKELFIYRCPVRITKKKKKRKLTVVEINNLKKAPNDYDSRRAKQNLDIMRDFTKKGIAQLRVVRALQSVGERTKGASRPSLTLQTSKFKEYVDERKSQEAYMEEQEYGAVEEEEEDEVKNSKEDKGDTNPIFRASKKLMTAFSNRRNSQATIDHFEKFKESPANSPMKKRAFNLFGWMQNEKPPSATDKGPEGEGILNLKRRAKDDLETRQKKAIDMRKSRKSVSGNLGFHENMSAFSSKGMRKTKTGLGLDKQDKRISVQSDKPKGSLPPLVEVDDQ